MSNIELIQKLRSVIDNYENFYTIRRLRNALYPLINDIRISAPENLYEGFFQNYLCVKNEMLYGGDEEDEKTVRNDCKTAIINVLTYLQNS